jgi:positive regulator of sigma E activity
MTVQPPAGQPAEQPGTQAAIPAAAMIDLSGGEETIGTSIARVVGGALLMIVSAVIGLALLAYYIAADFLPFGDGISIFGDFLLYAAIFAFVGVITGFELMRRSRKRRKAEAVQADLVMQRVQAAQANGTLNGANIDTIIDGPTGDLPGTTPGGLQWDGPTNKV